MKILDIITEAPTNTMTQAQFDAYFAAWRKQNPDAVAKLSSADPLTGAGPLSGKNPAAQKLLRTAIGIAPLIQLNLNLYALDQIAAQDLATFRASSPNLTNYTQADKDHYVKQMRDMYYGVWSAQILIPLLARWIGRSTPVVAQLLELIEHYIGRIPGKAGGAVRLAAELAVPLFVGFLGTDQGIAWLADSVFMPIIRMTGNGVALGWDKLWPIIQKYTGIELDKVNPNTQTAVDADREAGWTTKGWTDPYEFNKMDNDQEERINKIKRF